mgnify:CR=1 FL=1
MAGETRTKIDGTKQIRAESVTNAEISPDGYVTPGATGGILLSKLAEEVVVTSGNHPFTGIQSMGDNNLINVAMPVDPDDAASKRYVDAVGAGITWIAPSRVATTEALPACTAAGSKIGKTLTMDVAGLLLIDTKAVILNDRVLVKDQVEPHDNGIYKCTTAGVAYQAEPEILAVPAVLTRAIDNDEDAQMVQSTATFVYDGSANMNRGFVQSEPDPTVDTDANVWTLFSATNVMIAGDALYKSAPNTLDVRAGHGIVIEDDAVTIDYAKVVTRETMVNEDGLPGHVFRTKDSKLMMQGTEMVFLNGLLQEADGEDYAITNPHTITFVDHINSHDRVKINYIIANA